MTLDILKEALNGKPNFRLKQSIKLVFQDLIEDWNEASVFSLDLRNELIEKVSLKIEADMFLSDDKKSGKAIIKLKDDLKVETALMSHKNGRNTICVSSQIGCPLACKFCSTGQMGFKRNLDHNEILLQVLFWSRYLKARNEKVTNIVFMGMGEPFLNYNNVFLAIKFLNDKDFFNISSRKISISTVGLIREIKKMAGEKYRVNLAISLHASNDKTRNRLIPNAESDSIAKILEAVDFYIKKTGRKVMFEYLMIKDVNDSFKDAKSLATLMRKPLYFVNLIKYNENGAFKSSDDKIIKNFKNILQKEKVEVIERYRINQDVLGACGQLALKNPIKHKKIVNSNETIDIV
ncbi:23S rRNA (adenine(2503)-C(2))-methyltransferase RlmN [Candidatus Falkowbacteria bacterium HGW-Falkowbacteria-1]|jgi:23S rRNA (adenine2503-C2)-methyltransferase|uniref:23S rRNA (Adenine(2503)-C(2))-methyltransferase RlmN n=1 Tax=Candidatus Falkowbacteria bacterium HGW-Falkowbacteria-1 TaxID=2013768 RepID=A0A2N2E9I3_9BACT|nr:MAG: 23S rRNA (adenine(2503)-C(2))-methyltransferase RlmN [Candidatus Falkowbacteria bacterium HGW-Falkowbacteria-1]